MRNRLSTGNGWYARAPSGSNGSPDYRRLSWSEAVPKTIQAPRLEAVHSYLGCARNATDPAAASAPCATTYRAGPWTPRPCWHWSAATGGNPSGCGNGLHRTLDVPFQEDDCRLRWEHAPTVMGILRRAALNMVRTVQQNFRPDLSIGLLRDKIRRNPTLLAPLLARTRPFDALSMKVSKNFSKY